MSASPGKISIVGVQEICNERVIVLKFLQARNPTWIGRLFFARWDDKATWLSDLRPAFGEREWFWESEYARMMGREVRGKMSTGQLFG
jgi:hypothetical protein